MRGRPVPVVQRWWVQHGVPTWVAIPGASTRATPIRWLQPGTSTWWNTGNNTGIANFPAMSTPARSSGNLSNGVLWRVTTSGPVGPGGSTIPAIPTSRVMASARSPCCRSRFAHHPAQHSARTSAGPLVVPGHRNPCFCGARRRIGRRTYHLAHHPVPGLRTSTRLFLAVSSWLAGGRQHFSNRKCSETLFWQRHLQLGNPIGHQNWAQLPVIVN